jgi:membrane-bound metal-dependent hydrolase YbcI (DUF457 family)
VSALMPSPVGHALGGFAAGWIVARGTRLDRPIAAALAFACLGVVPDLDVIVEGSHRLYTHSIAAVAAIGLVALAAVRPLGASPGRLALACALAFGSHIVLDWLGDDRSIPYGIRALWPFTDAYFQSELRWFPPVERRYWLPSFWTANLRAIGVELLLLGPVAALAWWAARRRGRQA